MKRIAIIGSGPAGFYTAYRLLKQQKHVEIDMFEALPTPYGLVRYGVAPDHPDVKSVQNKFDSVAHDPRFAFFGNVSLGRSVSLPDLTQRYNSVVLSYGAASDRKLDIPGEQLSNVYTAGKFVGWYNGSPKSRDLAIDLSNTETAVIIGHGNVALDIARVLLTPIDTLSKTDITDSALQVLSKSQIKHVHLVGRRGPYDVKFTARELRETLGLPGVNYFHNYSLDTVKNQERPTDRVRLRILSLMEKSRMGTGLKSLHFDYFLSPTAIIPNEKRVKSVQFAQNEYSEDGRVIQTGESRTIESDIVFKSIGYKSIPVPGLPFDETKGVVPNSQGRVLYANGTVAPGLYVSGWLKTGPVGVIASTMLDAFQTADCISSDIVDNQLPDKSVPDRESVLGWLRTSLPSPPITFKDWKRVETEEKRRGAIKGKPMEKFTSTEEVLEFLNSK